VLTLIRSMLGMIGMEDVHLYEQKPGGLCTDVDWPDGPFHEAEIITEPKDRTAAERQRRRRAKHRDGERDSVTGGVTLAPPNALPFPEPSWSEVHEQAEPGPDPGPVKPNEKPRLELVS
jgi:hypothetical protein